MILDTLDQAARYESLHPHFARAFAFLRQVDGTQALGRHDLAGDDCFALVQTYDTKPLTAALMEAHRRYIDVQFLHHGTEKILWSPLSALSDPVQPHDDTKDAALWPLPSSATALRLTAGHFAIFHPHDAHAPCIEWDTPTPVFKVVIKVAV